MLCADVIFCMHLVTSGVLGPGFIIYANQLLSSSLKLHYWNLIVRVLTEGEFEL